MPIVPASLLIVPSFSFQRVLVWMINHVSSSGQEACSVHTVAKGSSFPTPFQAELIRVRLHGSTNERFTLCYYFGLKSVPTEWLIAVEVTGCHSSAAPGPINSHLCDPVN